MRTFSTVLTYLECIATTILSFVFVNGSLVFIPILGIIIRISLLYLRENLLNKGNRTGAGLLTLFLLSVLGGIFTFCIDDKDLKKKEKAPVVKRQPALSPKEKELAIEDLKHSLATGRISEAEYHKRKNEIEGNRR